MINSKEHLNKEGFLRILSLKTILNRGLSSKLIAEFPNIIYLTRPLLEPSNELLDPNWLAGFSAAEGSFSITISERDNRKIPQVRARFSIGLHSRDSEILIRIRNYLSVGNLYSNNQGTSALFFFLILN